LESQIGKYVLAALMTTQGPLSTVTMYEEGDRQILFIDKWSGGADAVDIGSVLDVSNALDKVSMAV
jgi:hypothetical protein